MKVFLAIYTLLTSFFIKPDYPKIRGIILPHHELANELYFVSLNRLKEENNYSTIVIYGTNHFYPVGPLFTTTEEVMSKYHLEDVHVDTQRIEDEHSIQVLIPYLKEYFMESNIIPLIVGSHYTKDEIQENVSQFISKFPKDTLFIASVDFSHETGVNESLENNNESINAIENFNYDKILSFGNDHLDSPTAIYTFLYTMEKINYKNWELWQSSYSGLLINSSEEFGTSYVIGVFSKGK